MPQKRLHVELEAGELPFWAQIEGSKKKRKKTVYKGHHRAEGSVLLEMKQLGLHVEVDSPHPVAEQEIIGGDILVLEWTGTEALTGVEAYAEALGERALSLLARLGKESSTGSRLLRHSDSQAAMQEGQYEWHPLHRRTSSHSGGDQGDFDGASKGRLRILEDDEEADGGSDELVGEGAGDAASSCSSSDQPGSPPDAPSSCSAPLLVVESVPAVSLGFAR
ncbi:uncharacterized protein A4U43_C04F32520 [Asparagus officinalis]|uniref:Uncharacterized protein n=1 Tax=Asparagus officinalis TaxID=4686 RepID=A0A5P1F6Z9_ASPOF|nr:uncharacterized protein A4U43_C04F32520 [Asparagus officinalis]